MRCQGIDRLVLSPRPGLPHLVSAECLDEVQRHFPDQNEWVKVLGGAVGAHDVGTLIRKLEYSGPPELLSGFLCLYCGKFGPLRGSLQEWRGALDAYIAQRGMVPHPAVLFRCGVADAEGVSDMS